jgi:hypothetical protein
LEQKKPFLRLSLLQQGQQCLAALGVTWLEGPWRPAGDLHFHLQYGRRTLVSLL